jgi:hypothetical protein
MPVPGELDFEVLSGSNLSGILSIEGFWMGLKGASMLFSEMTPGDDFAAEFERWYNEEHIPVRMRCPGFRSAQRYRRQDNAGYLAVYEMDQLGALSSDAYKAVKDNPSERTRWMLSHVTGFTRYLADEMFCRDQAGAEAALDAPLLYAVSFKVPPEAWAEFDSWYETEHIPTLMECRDWLMVRRMRVVDGVPDPYSHMALHYLASEGALSSPERDRARKTAWRDRLAKHEWFKASYVTFGRLGPRQQGLG